MDGNMEFRPGRTQQQNLQKRLASAGYMERDGGHVKGFKLINAQKWLLDVSCIFTL
jgi:hypothetical protein